MYAHSREGDPIDKEREIVANLDLLLKNHADAKVTPGAYMDVFNYYTNRGALDKAAEASKTLLAKYSDWPNIRRVMVEHFNTLSNRGHPEFARIAIENLDEIIQYAATHDDSELFEVATLSKGSRYCDLKQYDKAREVFEDFMSENPDSKIFRDFQVWHARSYYYEDNHAKAIEEYKAILDDLGDKAYWGPNACFMIAASYRESGKSDEAITWYEKTIRDYPNTSWAKVAKRDMDSLLQMMRYQEEKEGASRNENAKDRAICDWIAGPVVACRQRFWQLGTGERHLR